MKYNMYYCCLCDRPDARFKLCIQDNYQVLKYFREFQKIFREYNPYSFLRLCEECVDLMKLRVVIKCDFKDYQDQMQDSTSNITVTNCQCDTCRAKFGNLPLLAEVIEKIENKSSPQSSNLSETEHFEANNTEFTQETEVPINYCIKDRPQLLNTHTANELSEVKPSTSKELAPHRKIMSCEHCGKTFTHKGDMNKHLRKHTGEQPFSCPMCKRKFAHTSNLARHLKVHSGDKPFHCEKCNKSFSRKDKLVMHKKTKLCQNSSGHSSKSSD